MVFSSIIFLSCFLPITLLLYYLAGKWFRNIALLLVSLFFYGWGEGIYVFIMIGSIVINYSIGLLLDIYEGRTRKYVIVLGVAANLACLFFFKYANWFVHITSSVFHGLSLSPVMESSIHLPIGISFFTFQAISYIVDVYKGKCQPQRNLLNLGLYISSFPQLIAGPIVRYHDIAAQIISRKHSVELFASGVERFIIGLGKKVLIANTMAGMADRIFSLNYHTLQPELAWLGVVCYTLQIFFDFAGYSDMAIGLGRMFGFHFLENFNYPYISQSIQEFWRRWHISLSNWFRDYLYFPLGGNRKGEIWTYFNLFVVFLLCGLWHGASWNFVLWGMIHGVFLILERNILKRWLQNTYPFLRHVYTLFIVMNAWVFFRIENIHESFVYLKSMYGLSAGTAANSMVYAKMDGMFLLALSAGILFSTPVALKTNEVMIKSSRTPKGMEQMVTAAGKLVVLLALLYTSFSFLAVHSYNPFIYFRF